MRMPRTKRRPLITSSGALRGIATGITLLTTTGMGAFASTHVQNTAAPLQPAAATTSVAVAATPQPTAATTTARRRTTVTGSVTTTIGAATTKTHSS